MKMTRRVMMTAAAVMVAMSGAAQADGHQQMEDLHFLIPGGAGGGWDGTARGTGEALTAAGIVGSASYENMSGGGGGVAIAHMIENADSMGNTMMVNSTPIVIRSLTGVFPQSFRDLTLVAGTIGDYAALVVPADSEIQDMAGLVAAYQADANAFAIAGGSVPGGLDHLVAALAMQAAGEDPTGFNYIPYDAGGAAMASLLSGETQALSTGFSEAVALADQGEVRIIGVTAPERIEGSDAPTMIEQGLEVEFVNWRGFFAAPGLDEATVASMRGALAAMYDTPEWEEVRARNGWVNIHNPGDDAFRAFLEAQEQTIGDLMRTLGFL